MRKDGIVELDSAFMTCEDEIHPPYWGYKLTEKGKNTDYYTEQKRIHDEIIRECLEI